MKKRDPFSKYKECSICGRPLPTDYDKDFCPACEDDALFREVREYIRTHDVTEFELADIFHIPQSRVRKWIKAGRIEYAPSESSKMMNTYCQKCGVPITFGTLCANCMRTMNGNKEIAYVSMGAQERDKNRMRYLGGNDKAPNDKKKQK